MKTVKDLIFELAQFKPNQEVQFDTGDLCCDEVSIDLREHNNRVIIGRGDNFGG